MDPLTPEQKQALAEAAERARPLARAQRVAAFNGWTIGTFAAVTLLFAFTSVVALVLGIGMAVVAANEFRGRRLLRAFDPAGPPLLARNQLGFMSLIILYCLWSIHRTLRGGGPDLAELDVVLGGAQDLVQGLTVAVYVAVIAATLVFQGWNARYYWTRGKVLEDYLRETPAWVVDLQRTLDAGGGGAA